MKLDELRKETKKVCDKLTIKYSDKELDTILSKKDCQYDLIHYGVTNDNKLAVVAGLSLQVLEKDDCLLSTDALFGTLFKTDRKFYAKLYEVPEFSKLLKTNDYLSKESYCSREGEGLISIAYGKAFMSCLPDFLRLHSVSKPITSAILNTVSTLVNSNDSVIKDALEYSSAKLSDVKSLRKVFK